MHEHLSQTRSIDYATVQTYLRRLEQKGYLRTRRIGRNKLYTPKVSRRRVVGQVIQDLLKQLFDGRPLELMQYLIREGGFTPADLAELHWPSIAWRRNLCTRRGVTAMTDGSLHLIEAAWRQFWQLTLIVGLIALLVKFVGRKHPHLAYALWMVALLKCLMPPLGDFSGTLWSWIPVPAVRFGDSVGTVPNGTRPEDRAASGSLTESAGRTHDADHALETAVNRSGLESSAVASSRRIAASATASILLASAWMAGTLLILGLVWGRSVERRALLTELTTPPGDALETMVLALEARLGLRRAATVLLTECPIGPAVAGTRHPEIYLPRKLADTLSGARLEALLAHELIHVRAVICGSPDCSLWLKRSGGSTLPSGG